MSHGSRAVLAENIRRIAREQGRTLNSIGYSGEISRAQLFNVLGCRVGTSVDWIDELAHVLKVEPWQLLKPHRHR